MDLRHLVWLVLLIAFFISDGENPENQGEKKYENNKISSTGLPEKFNEQLEITRRRGIPDVLVLAIARHETANFSRVIGEGNYYGIKCIDSDSDPCIKVKTNETYCASLCYQDFQSGQDNRFIAEVLSNTIVNLGGLETKTNQQVKQAFDDDLYGLVDVIGLKYAGDPNWANSIKTIVEGELKNLPESQD